ncbi:hypothetical protein WDJ51_08585 [Rathayibacter sp. YIM 133350]|uniref:hypothetical protein n=1 Tax=Rathayibacter sp. YIM 133350 TaxID=3131992 RepID=UPI00307DDCCE
MAADDVFDRPDDPISPERSPAFREAAKKWGDMPESRRRDWCKVQLDFPPIWFGVVPMISTAHAVQRGSYSNITHWVEVARSFEAIGFSPDEYYLLRLCLDNMNVIDAELAREGGSDLIVETHGNRGGPRRFRLIPEGWMLWPELVRSGMTALRATRLIIDRGRQVIPDGMLINRDGTVLMSTGD